MLAQIRNRFRRAANRPRPRRGFAPSLELLESRQLLCGDVLPGIDLYESLASEDLFREIPLDWDAASIEPAEQGRSVDPLSNPELFDEQWEQHRNQNGGASSDGSVDPLSNPELFRELWQQYGEQNDGNR